MYYRNRCFRRLLWAPRDPNTSLPVVGMFAGIQYRFGIFGNGSGDFLGLPGTTGGWYVCRDTILVRYFWEWFRRFPWAPRDPHTGVGVPVAGSFFVVEIQYPVKKYWFGISRNKHTGQNYG